ncbi:glycosyltransferase [Gammaproteobacteria bacterium]
MKLTIITACRNNKDVIRTAMDSVLIQTYPDFEHLVVDGGSTDGTLDIIREYEKRFGGRMRWISEQDSGLYDALNKGIRAATGNVIGLLNADDYYTHTQVLDRVAGLFTNKGNASNNWIDAIYADVRFIKTENPSQEIRYYSARFWQPWMLRWGFMPPHPTFFCRREWFEKLGDYKINYKIAADYELLIRFLWRAGLKTHYLPEAIINMRMGGISTQGINSTITLNREIVRANRENGLYTNLLMMCPKYAFKIFEFVVPHLRRGGGDRL